MKVLIISLVMTAGLALRVSGDALDQIIDNMEIKTWYEIPNSDLQQAYPTDLYNYYVLGQGSKPGYAGVNGPEAIMTAWNGGTFDTRRERLIIWGGGHADYWGNEVYAFELKTLSWTRLSDPSPVVGGEQPSNTCQDSSDTECWHTCYNEHGSKYVYANGDVAPGVQHTYYHLGYIRQGPNNPDGLITPYRNLCKKDTWFFNFETNKWSEKATMPSGYIYGGGGKVVWDNNKHRLLFLTPPAEVYVRTYDPVTDTWDLIGSGPGGSSNYPMSAAFDYKRNMLVTVGYTGTYTVDLNITPNVRGAALSTSGANSIELGNAPGFLYDPVIDKMVAWDGGADIFTLDLDSAVWTKVTPAASNTVIPTATDQNAGTFGRFRYVPSRNIYIAVNAVDENVYIYKCSPGASVEMSNDSRRDLNITCSPNPFTSEITLRLKNGESGTQKVELKIYSITGELVSILHSGSRVLDSSYKWNASGCPAGVYFVQAKLGNKIISKKLFKTK